MTNIVEIVSQLNKENYKIDMVISDGKIYVAYDNELYDVTTMSFADQVRPIAYFLNKEIFG